MPTRILIVRRGDALFPADPESADRIRSMRERDEMAADVIQTRNPLLHKKAFAYTRLAFDYWQPKNHLTTIERETVRKLGQYLVHNGLQQEAVSTLCKSFLKHLNSARAGVEFDKDIESFREFITIEAGFYHAVVTPAGPRRIAKSWAFKNMPEEEMQRLFKAIRNVCWELVLSQTFPTIEEADAVAEQLMTFD